MDGLVRHAACGFGQLTVHLADGVYGVDAQKELRKVAEEPQEFLARGGTRIKLTNRICGALLKLSVGARDVKSPEDISLLACDTPKAKVEEIMAHCPAADGKLEPSRSYPRTLATFRECAAYQVGILTDWVGAELKGGFEELLSRLISMPMKVNGAQHASAHGL